MEPRYFASSASLRDMLAVTPSPFTEEQRASMRAELARREAEPPRIVVMGREHRGRGNWQLTEWEPEQITQARTDFPDSEFRLGGFVWAEPYPPGGTE